MPASTGAAAPADELRFPAWFTDHMVLQRDKQIPIWGWTKAGDNVTVQLGDETQTAKADSTGRWQVSFSPRPAGGPFILSANSGSTIKVSDVLIGDVWLISGQSNMQIPVKNGTGAEETIKTSQDDKLRLVHINERPSYLPQDDVKGQWLLATPKNAPLFSCVGYAFGRKLREELKDVPTGLIQAPVGSTCAEAWLSRDDLEENKTFAYYARDLDATAEKFPEMKKGMETFGRKWLKIHQEQIQANQLFQASQIKLRPSFPDVPFPRKVPALMYNGMIHPLIPYALRGVIWWQGGANAVPVERALEYRQLFPYLIRCWRKQWGQGDFPFIFAEEPTLKRAYWKPGLMLVREAQLMTAQKVPNTAVIVVSDLRNDADPQLIHFPQKPPVGQRMALAALAIEYKKPVVYCGPVYDPQKTRIAGTRIRIAFTHVESGLVARKGSLEDFTIAGEGQRFVKAHAEIEGETVVVWADSIDHPKAVRYDWDDWTGATLMNKDGLPASPFRTDDWPIRDPGASRSKPGVGDPDAR